MAHALGVFSKRPGRHQFPTNVTSRECQRLRRRQWALASPISWDLRCCDGSCRSCMSGCMKQRIISARTKHTHMMYISRGTQQHTQARTVDSNATRYASMQQSNLKLNHFSAAYCGARRRGLSGVISGRSDSATFARWSSTDATSPPAHMIVH